MFVPTFIIWGELQPLTALENHGNPPRRCQTSHNDGLPGAWC
jgi:hypothetical protein